MKKTAKTAAALSALLFILTLNIRITAANNYITSDMNSCTVTKSDGEGKVYLGGMPFGVKMYTNELTVVGFTDVETDDGPKRPAYDAGVRENDVILSINSKRVTDVEDIVQACDGSNGAKIELECSRNGEIIHFSFSPSRSSSDNRYKTGMWIKDGISGIGTVTYIVPETGAFAGLGHPICSVGTGEKVNASKSYVTFASITGVEKGNEGDPGELIGSIGSDRAGIVVSNADSGVYGIFSELPEGVKDDDLIETSPVSEVVSGTAMIKCTLNGSEAEYYDINLINVTSEGDSNKDFIIEVTDEELINKTGGIVQGMSGSPIVQNGKLVGAVTHVFVNDPTKGYGISIDEMQKNMPDILA